MSYIWQRRPPMLLKFAKHYFWITHIWSELKIVKAGQLSISLRRTWIWRTSCSGTVKRVRKKSLKKLRCSTRLTPRLTRSLRQKKKRKTKKHIKGLHQMTRFKEWMPLKVHKHFIRVWALVDHCSLRKRSSQWKVKERLLLKMKTRPHLKKIQTEKADS